MDHGMILLQRRFVFFPVNKLLYSIRIEQNFIGYFPFFLKKKIAISLRSDIRYFFFSMRKSLSFVNQNDPNLLRNIKKKKNRHKIKIVKII